ncbi:LLM class flavin-dependent oxidoreductase [Kineococcus radiotolerans]|uniref:Luciferase family protein n=1 Tax=Kineococcus radiotolerans (strain ATCC BAA-149 / DSM 14245 / SRS30216) TaxID=266940 RepID=A6WGJ9_KINRD|nr:LLM class flavin-dependent oxidoreductase [Kineococcus radiotolerans]ABS05938.1 luciferase family protein [Kineococcus radiotolerans SRS30216 = ATCC BAA-149]
MEIGVSAFAETTPDPGTGELVSHAERLRQVVEEIVLADQVGLDVYGLGEHHRPDYAASAPAVVLAAAASRTSRIRLSSAVTVLSSDDPVRVFQQFATLDGLSGGRAEIMAGRGSFIESFPLFGYDLEDYDDLYAEKLDLLLAIRQDPDHVVWAGDKHRAAIPGLGVFPRPVQSPLPVWIAVGGNPQSVVRAGTLGLPLAIAIIGGMPEQFAPLAELYREAGRRAGHDPSTLRVATHSHGFVAPTTQRATDVHFRPYQAVMNGLGRERGWNHFSRTSYEAARSRRGALLVGNPEEVAEKIVAQHEQLGIDRFMLHVSAGTMPHADVLKAIELLGTEVAPLVREHVG